MLFFKKLCNFQTVCNVSHSANVFKIGSNLPYSLVAVFIEIKLNRNTPYCYLVRNFGKTQLTSSFCRHIPNIRTSILLPYSKSISQIFKQKFFTLFKFLRFAILLNVQFRPDFTFHYFLYI